MSGLWLVTLIDNGPLIDKRVGEDVQHLLLIHPIAKRMAPQTELLSAGDSEVHL
jgi:hypothetical protein